MLRVTEPEIMDDDDQVIGFDNAKRDYSEDAFINWYKEYCNITSGTIVDLGCGPAKYLIRMCLEFPDISIIGVDGSKNMIDTATKNINIKKLENRITLFESKFNDIKDIKTNCVVSSGTLHHVHDPSIFWNTVKRIATPNCSVFVMDLIRPDNIDIANNVVSKMAGNENQSFKNDFLNSLKASFTKKEIEDQLINAEIDLKVSIQGDPNFVQIVLIHGNLL